MVLGFILAYTLRQDKMVGWRLTNPAAIFAAGLGLGVVAISLGIGGGPLNVATTVVLPLISLYNCVTNVLAM